MFGRIANPHASGTEAYAKICGPPTGKFLHTSHGRTHYKLQGPEDAEYLVILQVGIGSDIAMMNKIARELLEAGKYQVLQFEFYDRGYSESDPKKYPIRSVGKHPLKFTAELHVEQTREVLKGLGLTEKPLIHVGHSMGALTGICYSATYSEQVRGLVLMSAVCLPVDKPLIAKIADLPCLGDILVKLFGLAAFKDFITNGSPGTTNPELLELKRRELTNADTNPRYFAAVRSTNGHCVGMTGSAEEYFRKCCQSPQKYPIHMIWGEDDRSVPLTNCLTMKGIAEKAGCPVTVTSYPGIQHNVFMPDNKEEECRREIAEFVAKVTKP